MNENRRRILRLLAEGKINADEAERLIAAIECGGGAASPEPTHGVLKRSAKFLRVEVDAHRPDSGPTRVNIRVPIMMLRAGVRLSALIPPAARDEVNAAMAKQGVNFDINQLKPENLEALVEQLGDLSVNVDNERATVRIYCE